MKGHVYQYLVLQQRCENYLTWEKEHDAGQSACPIEAADGSKVTPNAFCFLQLSCSGTEEAVERTIICSLSSLFNHTLPIYQKGVLCSENSIRLVTLHLSLYFSRNIIHRCQRKGGPSTSIVTTEGRLSSMCAQTEAMVRYVFQHPALCLQALEDKPLCLGGSGLLSWSF